MSSRPRQVYQIDFTAVAAGKRIANTKRRVRWRFGFANMAALDNGEVGTACRGEEHDVTFVWSLTSGKRLVLADGQEVHYSHSRVGIFEYSWTMRGNHVLKVVAHASPPMAPTPGFRQYDFFVDGQSFFSFPKVYRLGMSSNDPRGSSSQTMSDRQVPASARRRQPSKASSTTDIASIEAPRNPDEEEAYLQEAIRQSLKDAVPKAKDSVPKSKAPPSGGDLLDFGGPPAPVPALPPSSSDPFTGALIPAPQPAYAGDPFAFTVSQPSTVPLNAAHIPPPPQQASGPFSTMPYSSTDPFAASSSAPNPFSAPASTNGYGYSNHQYVAPAPAAPPSTSALMPTANGYGQQYNVGAVAPANSYGQQYTGGAAVPAGQPAYAYNSGIPSNIYGVPESAPAWKAPPPVETHVAPHDYVPPSVTPLAQPTPSSLGFSPQPDFSGFSPVLKAHAESYETSSEPTGRYPTMNAPQNDDNYFGSDNKTSGSLVDQAYAKLVNLDTFSLASKNEKPSSNPYASFSGSINDNRSLADLQKTKPAPIKQVMNSQESNALVVSSNQNTNYASQYGIQSSYQPGQNSLYGQQPTYQQPSYGQPPGQQSSYGQQSNQQSSYGQPSGQQSSYGQPSNQLPSYGQPLSQPSSYGQQSNQQSSYGQPSGQQSLYGSSQYGLPPPQPGQSQSVAAQPAYGSTFGQPPFGQPSTYTQPQYGQPPSYGQPQQQPGFRR